jgi:hypothetical protein
MAQFFSSAGIATVLEMRRDGQHRLLLWIWLLICILWMK